MISKTFSLYISRIELPYFRLLMRLFNRDLIEMFFTKEFQNFQNSPFHRVFICNIEGGDLYQN